jgi:hypothetical protein
VAQRGFERLVDHFVQAQRPEHGVTAQARDDFRSPRQDAGLRAAQQLIAAERNQVGAGLQAVGNQRLADAECAQVRNATAAQVFVNRNATLPA